MKPNKKNFCGGNFQDWLEVNLIEKCNGNCVWCIERNGYHPKEHASWEIIASRILSSGKTNIILLGGEPTLYKDLKNLVHFLSQCDKKVWITTNGSKLTKEFILSNLPGIAGINISIHNFNLSKNLDIVGVHIENLLDIIDTLHSIGASVRFNCNCISGHIDSEKKIDQYIMWARMVGADSVRFAELKRNDGWFVDLAKVLNYKYGLNDDPFKCGCNSDAVIHGVPVNFRQMCGLQTPHRKKPVNPVQYAKQVLYYDGKFYDGWQTNKEDKVDDKDIIRLLNSVKKGKTTVEDAFEKIKAEIVRLEGDDLSGGCQY